MSNVHRDPPADLQTPADSLAVCFFLNNAAAKLCQIVHLISPRVRFFFGTASYYVTHEVPRCGPDPRLFYSHQHFKRGSCKSRSVSLIGTRLLLHPERRGCRRSCFYFVVY